MENRLQHWPVVTESVPWLYNSNTAFFFIFHNCPSRGSPLLSSYLPDIHIPHFLGTYFSNTIQRLLRVHSPSGAQYCTTLSSPPANLNFQDYFIKPRPANPHQFITEWVRSATYLGGKVLSLPRMTLSNVLRPGV